LNFNFNLQLKLNGVQIQLKWKVYFNLAYGLHHFQIEFHLQIEIAIWNLKFTCTWYIHYMIFKFNFNYKLKLQFEISNCYFNLRFQIAISICKWNWMLGKFGQFHLKGKVYFNLAYGLHHFQIAFHLKIEIAIWN